MIKYDEVPDETSRRGFKSGYDDSNVASMNFHRPFLAVDLMKRVVVADFNDYVVTVLQPTRDLYRLPMTSTNTETPARSLPELMSPAGHWPQLRAAIECGADAVYFGLKHFSARAKVGFALNELGDVMSTLHQRGVKGFVTFNTLVFDHELQQAESAIAGIAEAGVDAVIVQDWGVAKLIHSMAPKLEIHGSTQMSITSAQGAEYAANLGCRRVVLGRELGIQDIRKIKEATNVELEVFVHGALCVSYSGQCFSSEAWGGRSANRGKCAQACRLSYDLIVDEQPRDLGAFRYLLSPGDLCTIDQIPQLIELGIDCLKIEGRYKDANYVAMTTRAYRDAIDLAALGESELLEPSQHDDLEQIYSRGLGAHFMSGTNHQTVVIGRAPRHRGRKVGAVSEVRKDSVVVDANVPILPGDGLVFDAADWRSPDQPEEGGRVFEVINLDAQEDDAEHWTLQLKFKHSSIDYSRVRKGDLVWRSHDPQLIKRLKPLTQNSSPVFTRPLSFRVVANLGQPLMVTAFVETENGMEAVFEHEENTTRATKRALDRDQLNEKLGRLGGTPFHLGRIELETTGDVFVPTSLLNQIRRGLVEAIVEQLAEPQPIECHPGLSNLFPAVRSSATESLDVSPRLHVLVRSDEQLQAILKLKDHQVISSVTLDYLELYGLRPAVEQVKEAGLRARVASPRILKPAEQNVFRFLVSLNCDILVRSTGLLYELQQVGFTNKESPNLLIGDFSLNAANSLSVQHLLDQGLTTVTPTFDLNAQQIQELTARTDPSRLEVICFSHLPIFHTEHCVFCRFLSDGTDNTNCGHPCEKHQVSVQDQHGRKHPVMADVGCRNTVFNAEAQTDEIALQRWLESGLRAFRIELVHEDREQTATIVTAFSDFLKQAISLEQLKIQLESVCVQGTTQGSLFVPKDFKTLVQLEG